jgi:hypothetical protein
MNTTRTANSPPHALTRSGPGKRRSILKKSKAVKQNKRSRNILLAALGLSVVGGLYWAVRDQKATVVPSSPVGPPTAKCKSAFAQRGRCGQGPAIS